MINFETGNVELNETSMVALQEVLSKHGSAEVKVDSERFNVEIFDQHREMIYFTSRDRENTSRLEGYKPLHIRDLGAGFAANTNKKMLQMLNTGQFTIS